jgi:hypothetical protein
MENRVDVAFGTQAPEESKNTVPMIGAGVDRVTNPETACDSRGADRGFQNRIVICGCDAADRELNEPALKGPKVWIAGPECVFQVIAVQATPIYTIVERLEGRSDEARLLKEV